MIVMQETIIHDRSIHISVALSLERIKKTKIQRHQRQCYP
jgi:hypothetical protein